MDLKFNPENEEEISQIMYFGYKDNLFYNKSENNDIKTSRITYQIDRIRISMMHYQTMQSSKMIIETINILIVEAKKSMQKTQNFKLKV